MKRILILYYSGAGNTKNISKLIADSIVTDHNISTYSIEKLPLDFDMNEYDGAIIGFPTIHGAPAKPIIDFLENMEKLKKPIGIYIFTTCGLYSANAGRIFAKKIVYKNLIPIMDRSYRSPAIDGILLAPFIKFFFTYEKHIKDKIKKDVLEFEKLLELPLKMNIPRIKLYSILNYPNKVLGQATTFKIYVNKQKCIKCGKCSLNCPEKAFENEHNNYPIIDKSKCINCYRCIHHCPKKALSLRKNKSPKKTFENSINQL